MSATRSRRAWAWLRALWAQDRAVSALVAAFVAASLLAALWDLPGSHGWENDAIAPRDLFGGLAVNLTPGRGHRYPLFHYLLLALGALPGLLVGVARAPSLSGDAITQAVLAPGVMTWVSLAGKGISIGMTAGSLFGLAHLARRLSSDAAARLAVAAAATNLSLTYYGRSSNLDAPLLFWATLACVKLLDLNQPGARRRDAVLFAVFAALAVATKDQAYAGFVLTAPLYALALPLWTTRAAQRAAHLRDLAAAGGLGALTYAAASGALFNPTGFLARLGLLTGANSQDWKSYDASPAGMWANLADLASSQADFWWPWPTLALAWLGVALALTSRHAEPRLALRVLPAVMGLSSLLFFTLVVGRTGPRFALPLGFWLSLYVGVALAAALRIAAPTRLRRPAQALTALLLVAGLHRPVALALTQWGDARHQIEAWLDALPPGATVETYGLLVYQPHFHGAGARYQLVHPDLQPVKKRNPLYGAHELLAPEQDALTRQPDILIITEGYAARFLVEVVQEGPRVTSASLERWSHDQARARFFQQAVRDQLPGYARALEAAPRLPAWAAALGMAPIEIHGCTARRVWALRRLGPAAAPPSPHARSGGTYPAPPPAPAPSPAPAAP